MALTRPDGRQHQLDAVSFWERMIVGVGRSWAFSDDDELCDRWVSFPCGRRIAAVITQLWRSRGSMTGVEGGGAQCSPLRLVFALQTMALVSMGSALYVILGAYGIDRDVDPTRVVAQIVTGVGFSALA